jgi:membrane-associated phospholipid phosphatase
MHSILDFIRNADIQLYYLLCRGHGNWWLDRIVSHQESNSLLKSGLFFAIYTYFWFRKSEDQEKTRRSIVTIIAATLLGLVTTRVLATVLPFRVRPLYDANLQHYPLSIPIPTNFMGWSSFPSDHAVYLGALGFGLICLSRRLTIPVTLYVAGWICLPRMYLGIHYASDIVVGAGIGVVTVWAALRAGWIRSRVASPVLAFANAKPQLFYPAAYLVLFEMSLIFSDIRGPIRALLHAASIGPNHKAIGVALVLFGSLCAIGIAASRHRIRQKEIVRRSEA